MESYKLSSGSKPPGTSVKAETNLNIYYYQLGEAILKKKTLKELPNITSTYDSESYVYNEYGLIKEKRRFSSNETEYTRYPSDINNGVYKTMVERRMIDYPIEIVSNRSRVPFYKGVLNTYKMFSNDILHESIYKCSRESDRNLNRFTFYNGNTLGKWYSKPEYTILKYDSMHNLREVKEKKTNQVYIWNSKNQLVAIISNATYEEIILLCPEVDRKTFTMEQIDNLRNQMTKAQITTYTYSDFNTISSKKDSRGIITQYNYTSFGELETIRDLDNNIISAFKYKYKNEQ